ncbi:hypothetical protein IGI04_032271 [Brassica rapa subsp. trilocularis]|uniref:Response regulatory domain-containing protein n=1 Tax=Brassica rapa subsp. trilocularis TaxID=1813537 RepID=A0ABQ7LYU5_BRACM|nr:hypothetical protein IGI04_032271 [Brassica rapa subsp. trilocularis]
MAVGEVMRMEVPTGGDLTVSSPDLHVLAVDDSIVDRKVIERLLRISSCKVTTVENGTRALQYLGLDGNTGASDLKDLKVNLIVTDYSMPGLTGYDLLKKIKESSTFREIPVVIMSSENILTRIEQCLKEGAEDFLLKPVKLADNSTTSSRFWRGFGVLHIDCVCHFSHVVDQIPENLVILIRYTLTVLALPKKVTWRFLLRHSLGSCFVMLFKVPLSE